MSYQTITKCRVCGNSDLRTVLDLGTQAHAGFFPFPGEMVPACPIEVVQCTGMYPEVCNLVQLKHFFPPQVSFSDSYGYYSSLAGSMVKHLEGIFDDITKRTVSLRPGDRIIDIASSDGTLLNLYKKLNLPLDLIGIDPIGERFKSNYSCIELISGFFGEEYITNRLEEEKARVITSIACLYNNPDPLRMAQHIERLMGAHSIWMSEQAYLPATIKTNDLTFFCIEHLTAPALHQIEWLCNKAYLNLFDVSFNDCNGGSFRTKACGMFSSVFKTRSEILDPIMDQETDFFSDSNLFSNFKLNIDKQKDSLLKVLNGYKGRNETVMMLGASTKANVLLQYYGIDTILIKAVGEINDSKFGRTTPGSNIPIIPEEDVLSQNPAAILIGPWHFRDSFLNNSKIKDYREKGGRLIFPLPEVEVV